MNLMRRLQLSFAKITVTNWINVLDLGEELYLKLVKGVEKALKFQLTQIDEDSFEEDY